MSSFLGSYLLGFLYPTQMNVYYRNFLPSVMWVTTRGAAWYPVEENSAGFHSDSEIQLCCIRKVQVIFLAKREWTPSSRTSLGVKKMYSLSISSTVFSRIIHSPQPPHLFYSKVINLLSVRCSNDTILIQSVTPAQIQVLNVVTDLNIDVQPLIMTLRLLIIVPGM